MKTFVRLSVVLSFLGLILGGLSPVAAQSVGDTTAVVRKQRGLPNAMRDAGDRQIWIYADGTRVVFSRGRVVADDGATLPEADEPATAVGGVPTSTTNSVTIHAAPQSKSTVAPGGSNPRNAKSPTLTQASRLSELLSQWPFLAVAALSVVSFACHILIIVRAFKESMFWGLGCLFIPIVGLFFVIQHWYDTRGPFLLNLACVGAMVPLIMLFGPH